MGALSIWHLLVLVLLFAIPVGVVLIIVAAVRRSRKPAPSVTPPVAGLRPLPINDRGRT